MFIWYFFFCYMIYFFLYYILLLYSKRKKYHIAKKIKKIKKNDTVKKNAPFPPPVKRRVVSKSGSCSPTQKPTVASMATRPWVSSDSRQRRTWQGPGESGVETRKRIHVNGFFFSFRQLRLAPAPHLWQGASKRNETREM